MRTRISIIVEVEHDETDESLEELGATAYDALASFDRLAGRHTSGVHHIIDSNVEID